MAVPIFSSPTGKAGIGGDTCGSTTDSEQEEFCMFSSNQGAGEGSLLSLNLDSASLHKASGMTEYLVDPSGGRAGRCRSAATGEPRPRAGKAPSSRQATTAATVSLLPAAAGFHAYRSLDGEGGGAGRHSSSGDSGADSKLSRHRCAAKGSDQRKCLRNSAFQQHAGSPSSMSSRSAGSADLLQPGERQTTLAGLLEPLKTAWSHCWPHGEGRRARLRSERQRLQGCPPSNSSGSTASPTTRCFKMLIKRHQVLIIYLTLLTVSCLIATLAISRSVKSPFKREAQLAEELASNGSSAKGSRLEALANRRLPPAAGAAKLELEERDIQLIDLIECGKTFALIKSQVRVRLPAASPPFVQTPAHLSPLVTGRQAGAGEWAPSSGDRFQLTDASTDDAPLADFSEPSEAIADSSTAEPSSTSAPRTASGKPDALPAASGRLVPQTGSGEPAGTLLNAGARSEDPDPLLDLAASLHTSPAGLNRTLLHCFFVDTDKRYNQKVALEDKHRLSANTRRVSFSHMLRVLIECRELDWSRPAPTSGLSSKMLALDADGQTAAAAAAASAAVAEAAAADPNSATTTTAGPAQPGDFVGALLSRFMSRMPAAPAESWQAQPAAEEKPESALEDLEARRVANMSGPAAAGNAGAAFAQHQPPASYLKLGLSLVSGLVPNTLWCGLGDRAANYTQLGPEHLVDSCCRAHDHCPIRLKPFATDYGIVNWSVSTRSHCDCDWDFNQCLKQVNSSLSHVIRTLYFRVVGQQCIELERRASGDPVTSESPN